MGKKDDLSGLREQFEKEKGNYVMPKEWEKDFTAIYQKETKKNRGALWIAAAIVFAMILGAYVDVQLQAISLLF